MFQFLHILPKFLHHGKTTQYGSDQNKILPLLFPQLPFPDQTGFRICLEYRNIPSQNNLHYHPGHKPEVSSQTFQHNGQLPVQFHYFPYVIQKAHHYLQNGPPDLLQMLFLEHQIRYCSHCCLTELPVYSVFQKCLLLSPVTDPMLLNYYHILPALLLSTLPVPLFLLFFWFRSTSFFSSFLILLSVQTYLLFSVFLMQDKQKLKTILSLSFQASKLLSLTVRI